MDLKSRLFSFSAMLAIVALLLSVFLTFYLYKHLTPLKSERVYETPTLATYKKFFRDFNGDGFSESYEVKNDPREGAHYILFETFDGAVIDQFNLNERVNPLWVFFGDYTQDGYDDCFVFTVHKDSLFLYGYDINQTKTFLRRYFLMHIPYPHPHFNIAQAKIYDLHRDFNPELLFIVHAGLASHPRGLYAFDIKKKKIVQQFENAANKTELLMYDLDGDGSDEIILGCRATGNTSKDLPFNDWRSWIFILDQNFKLKMPPLSFGHFPSCVDILPVQINENRYLLVSNYDFAPQFAKHPFNMFLINSEGHIKPTVDFKRPYDYNFLKINDGKKQYLYLATKTGPGMLVKMNLKFDIVKEIKTQYKQQMIRMAVDMNLDGKPDLLVNSIDGTQIYDQDLNLLCKLDKTGETSVRHYGAGVIPEIGINTPNYFYTFKIVKNPYYRWLPYLSTVFFFVFFALLKIGNSALMNSLIFFNYFKTNIRQTSDAIILLKPNGRIIYSNDRCRYLLNIKEPKKGKVHYRKIFQGYSELLACIDESFKSKDVVQKDFVVNKGNTDFTGEIGVTPFKTHFGYVYAYLIRIKDFTKPVLSDRQQTWSRTVRKMAHDIKTPLGAVLLNIERIQQKIQDSAPAAIENTKDDFQMTISEVKRIQEMTKNFLKFTNLEEPDLQPVQLNDILQNILFHFAPYLNEHLKIELNLEQEEHSLMADPKQLEMALQIFIENSIDALKGNGKILISSVLAQNLEYHFQNELEIEIADNGPGIPENVKDRIFEPFFSTKMDGTGMGLAIAKKIINDHGGSVEVISKEQFGAVFRIVLPAKRGVL